MSVNKDAARLLTLVQKHGRQTRQQLVGASLMFGDQFEQALKRAIELGYLAEDGSHIVTTTIEF